MQSNGKYLEFYTTEKIKKKKKKKTNQPEESDQTDPTTHACFSLEQLPEAVCWHRLRVVPVSFELVRGLFLTVAVAG